MPRPVKIKKKKSFMFTTKHHSFIGIVGVIVGIISYISLAGSIYLTFLNRGSASENLGGVGLFAAMADVIGILCGLVSIRERDIHKWVPIAAVIGNSIALSLWIILVIVGANGL